MFKQGDKVKRINFSNAGMIEGEIYTVEYVKGDDIKLIEHDYCFSPENFKLIENEQKFKVGDRVKRIKHCVNDCVVGEVYTVTQINKYDRINVNGSEYVYDPKYFEFVTNIETLNSTHESITKEMHETYKLKNEKYGDSFGISFRKFGMIAALVRISDKYNRMEQLILNDDNGTNDESLEDTMLDMANYLIMAVMEKRNKHDEEQ